MNKKLYKKLNKILDQKIKKLEDKLFEPERIKTQFSEQIDESRLSKLSKLERIREDLDNAFAWRE